MCVCACVFRRRHAAVYTDTTPKLIGLAGAAVVVERKICLRSSLNNIMAMWPLVLIDSVLHAYGECHQSENVIIIHPFDYYYYLRSSNALQCRCNGIHCRPYAATGDTNYTILCQYSTTVIPHFHYDDRPKFTEPYKCCSRYCRSVR